MFIAAFLTLWMAVAMAWAPWRLFNLDVLFWKVVGYLGVYGVGLGVMVWQSGATPQGAVAVIVGCTIGTIAGMMVGEGLYAWAEVDAEARIEELMEMEGLSHEQQ